MISEKDLEEKTLDDWVNEFYQIYFKQDKKRTIPEVWLHLQENASKVGEALRQNKYGLAFKELAHVFCWLCSFVAKCNDEDQTQEFMEKMYLLKKKFWDIIWHKYPGVCYKCGNIPCECLKWGKQLDKGERKLDIEKDLEGLRKNKPETPPKLDKLVEKFRLIYENVHYALPIEYLGFHFLEEVGEVAREILELTSYRNKDFGALSEEELKGLKGLQTKLGDELADVFSWIASLLVKINFICEALSDYYGVTSERKEIKLSRIVWDEYKCPRGDFLCCPYCKGRPCVCKPLVGSK